MTFQPNPSNKPNKMVPPPGPPDAASESAWALRIAKVSGIPIRVHFTFLLLLIWLALSDLNMGGASLIVSMLGLFLCIVLHELGHSLTAQRLGYRVRDITLYPDWRCRGD